MEFAIIAIFGLIGIAIAVLIIWLISDSLAAVPEQYRAMSPGQVYLLLIPLFNIVWIFFVFSRVPESFRRYFEAVGRPQPGDYGKGMGLWYCICALVSIVPCLGAIAGLAGLVLLIMLLVKFRGYKKVITSGAGGGFQVMPPARM